MSMYFIKDLIMALEEPQTPPLTQREIKEVFHYYAKFRSPFEEDRWLREAWKTNLLNNREAIVQSFKYAFDIRLQIYYGWQPAGKLFPIFFNEAFPIRKPLLKKYKETI